MADVAGRIDRRAADVHADLAGSNRLERLFGLTQSVINAQRHETISTRSVRLVTSTPMPDTLQGGPRSRQPEDYTLLGVSRSTTAWQEIASPRPIGPTCSPVLALTFTAVSPTRSNRARLARMACLCGPSLGSCA